MLEYAPNALDFVPESHRAEPLRKLGPNLFEFVRVQVIGPTMFPERGN
jgi:hypothetical protein